MGRGSLQRGLMPEPASKEVSKLPAQVVHPDANAAEGVVARNDASRRALTLANPNAISTFINAGERNAVRLRSCSLLHSQFLMRGLLAKSAKQEGDLKPGHARSYYTLS